MRALLFIVSVMMSFSAQAGFCDTSSNPVQCWRSALQGQQVALQNKVNFVFGTNMTAEAKQNFLQVTNNNIENINRQCGNNPQCLYDSKNTLMREADRWLKQQGYVQPRKTTW